jgi:hypothetical protein
MGSGVTARSPSWAKAKIETKVEKIIVTGYRNYLAQARQTFVEKPKYAEIEDAYYESYFVPVQPPLPADIE